MRILLAVAATLALAASVSAQQVSPEVDAAAPETIRGAPGNAFAPPRAVDHVVEMTGNRDPHRPSDIYRAVVMRSGDWVRTDRGGEARRVRYSNLAAGVSIEIERDSAGRLSSLFAHRHPANDAFHVFTRVRTGERDTHLSEPCEVWRFTFRDRDRGPFWLSCVTGDGVELWSRALYSSGEIMMFERAIAVERRPVRADEVRPPAEALDWAAWRRDVGPTEQAPNDEVRLVGNSSWSERGELVIRRRDGWTYRMSPSFQSYEMRHEASGLELLYRTELDGRPLELVIDRPADGPRPPSPASVVLNETAIVLGERCTWIDRRPDDPVSDLHECVTRDGVILWIRGSSMGDTLVWYEYKAVRIRRGWVSAADMSPPATAFAWLQ